jgi:hypothetical protein
VTLALEIDTTFIQGVAAFISAIIVFVGSVAFLLSLVLGGRLAYFLSATITLAFVLIMAVVWSFGWNTTPLGPVGQQPEWHVEAVADSVADVDFGGAADYPDGGGWHAANPDDQGETARASELESSATDALEQAITDEEVSDFLSITQATVNQDLTRLMEQGGTEYGGVTFEAAPDTGAPSDAQAVVFMSYDPGNPYGVARVITAGTFVLFVLHLFGLSRSERKVRRKAEEEAAGEAG